MSIKSVTDQSSDVVGTITGQLEPLPEFSAPPVASVDEVMLHDIETFRTYAIETIERSVDRLMISIAEEVLGRELVLSPADVDEITRRALRRYDREGPVRVRVSAADLGTVQTELPIVVDQELGSGDLIIEVRDGMLDARLDVRLDCVLRRFVNSKVE